MRHFTSVYDLPNLAEAIKTAREIKLNPYGFQDLGKNKTMVLIFFDSSLRTRLSTQKAAMNLGMNTMVLNVNQDGWRLESELGVVMDGDKPEHLREAFQLSEGIATSSASAHLPVSKARRMITTRKFSTNLFSLPEFLL